METLFVHGDQKRIDYTPSGAAIANGEVVPLGTGGVGICTTPGGIADGTLGSLAVSGFFKFAKDNTAGPVFAVGDIIEWDNTGNLAVVAGTVGATPAAVCTKAAGASAAWVEGELIHGMAAVAP